jgi:hypothetical protein
MPRAVQSQAAVETIVMLAEQIAQAAPECAAQAMRIIELVNELDAEPDRALVKDVLEAETADADVSNARIETAAEAVMKAVRDAP